VLPYVVEISVQLTDEGYLKRGLVEALEQTKIIMKEMKRRRATQQITTVVLFNLSQLVNLLFSQIISVGSAASSMLSCSPRRVLMLAYWSSTLTVSL
jgi:hypothetical protein